MSWESRRHKERDGEKWREELFNEAETDEIEDMQKMYSGTDTGKSIQILHG